MTDHTLDRLLTAPVDTTRLREHLAAQAQQEDLLDVLVRRVASPIGALLLAATPRGLAYVGFEVEEEAVVLEMLVTRLGPRVVRLPGTGPVEIGAAEISPAEAGAAEIRRAGAGPAEAAEPGPVARTLETAAGQLGEYLEGVRRDFDLPLDTTLATGFHGRVQRHLAEVGYGSTTTYKELATELERPGAVRAVGTACATNPLPLVWPCHRILRSDGGLGGYRGGLDAKRRLLAMESAA